jgi:hypothetical protein
VELLSGRRWQVVLDSVLDGTYRVIGQPRRIKTWTQKTCWLIPFAAF